MVEDGRARSGNVDEPAQGHGTETDWRWDIGVDKVEAATRALAAANDAGALSIDPVAVASITERLSAIKTELLNDVALMSFHLTSGNSLGGGYAEKVGEVNRKIAAQALGTVIPELAQAIDDLRAEIMHSRADYLRTDDDQEAALGHVEGQVR